MTKTILFMSVIFILGIIAMSKVANKNWGPGSDFAKQYHARKKAGEAR